MRYKVFPNFYIMVSNKGNVYTYDCDFVEGGGANA
jgi:hypothetical protein